MKAILTLLFISSFAISQAAPGDTTWVQAHQKTDMTWYGNYSDTAHFPDGSKTYHKILMHYTLGCATGGCSPWDYTTRVYLMKSTGIMDSNVASIDTISVSPLQIDTTWNVFEAKEPFELARVITPYGGNLANNWTHDFVYDVTDFYPLMKNDVEIRVQYQGYSSGFSAGIKFAFIEGPPARPVIKVENLYQGSGSYLNSTDFENNNLPPKTVSIDTATKGLMLRVNFSGHGFVNSLNCGEFCKKDYYVKVNNQKVVTQAIWRDDCGLNPVWPQAGTWLYDRANWCPGNRSLFRTHELTSSLAGSSLNIDVDIEPYSYTVPPGETPAGYNYAVQLFQYGAIAHQNDVELERILAPSNEDENARINPICGNAIVRIRNKGAMPLTSCQIGYGMDGGNWKTYNWTGNLGFMQSEVVELPFGGAADWMSYKPAKTFVAIADLPNGQADEEPLNNWYQTSIVATPVFPSKLIFTLRTNSAASETHWTLSALDGTIISSGDNLSPNTLYSENFDLQPGCYIFHLEDRGKDGLSFPFNSAGSGFARFQNDGGSFFIKNFNSNFGTELKTYFTVGFGIGLKENKTESILDLYPNPSSGNFHMDLIYEGQHPAEVKVYDLSGKEVFSLAQEVNNEWKQDLDLSFLPKGIYSCQIKIGQEVRIQKLIIQ